MLYDILPVILPQLLRQKSMALRNERKHAELQTALHRLQDLSIGQCTQEAGRILAMKNVALRVIDLFDELDILYVIVDRADRCRDKNRIDHRKTLMRTFVEMVEATRCRIRILTVIDGGSWCGENVRDELGERRKERVIVHTAEQQYLDSSTLGGNPE